MNIIIRAKNITLTPLLREFIETKISSLEKYCRGCQVSDDPALSANSEAVVEVGKSTLHHKKGDVFEAQCQLMVNGSNIIAECDAADLEKAIDAVCDDLQEQLTKLKDKSIDKAKRGI